MSSFSLLPLKVQSVWAAVRAREVREVLGERAWVSIPGSKAMMPGVLAWRGRAIAVLDLGALIDGLEPLGADAKRPRTLVAQVGANAVALPVDAVREVREVDDEALRPLHATRQKYSTLEVEIDGELMPVLDLSSLIETLAHAEVRS